ncbi:hypothetical protein MMC17_007941 [Xylographa soralifera]|nr:hypothetical protein [Xylographa soralifera]
MNLLDRTAPELGSLIPAQVESDETLEEITVEQKKAAITKGKQVARAAVDKYKSATLSQETTTTFRELFLLKEKGSTLDKTQKGLLKLAETDACKAEVSSVDVIVTNYAGCAQTLIRENANPNFVIWQEAAKSGTETFAGLTFYPVPTHMSGDHYQGRPFEEDERENNFANQTNYRMISPINDIVSKVFYRGKLQSCVNTFDRPVAYLAEMLIKDLYDIDGPIAFLNLHRASERIRPTNSKRNGIEAQAANTCLVEIIEKGIPAKKIIVFAPYMSQVRLMEKQLNTLENINPTMSQEAGIHTRIEEPPITNPEESESSGDENDVSEPEDPDNCGEPVKKKKTKKGLRYGLLCRLRRLVMTDSPLVLKSAITSERLVGNGFSALY